MLSLTSLYKQHEVLHLTPQFQAAYGFIALGAVPLIAFFITCIKHCNSYEGQISGGVWGKRGNKFLAEAVLAWIGTILGFTWVIFGCVDAVSVGVDFIVVLPTCQS